MTEEQNSLLEKTYKKFVRGGSNLKAESKERFREINSELSILSLKFGENQFAKDTSGQNLNYLTLQKITQDIDVLVTTSHHKDQACQEGLAAVLVRNQNLEGQSMGVFQMRIGGKSWDDCTPEELDLVAKAKFTAEDIGLSGTPGVTSLFMAEFPFKDRNGNYVTAPGFVFPSGEVNVEFEKMY